MLIRTLPTTLLQIFDSKVIVKTIIYPDDNAISDVTPGVRSLSLSD